MVEYVKEPFQDDESLGCLDEKVRGWFLKTFGDLTPPQRYSFKLISEGKNLLVTAPTGSGKTLSAFTAIISELYKLSKEGRLEERIYCIYISPLRALSNDVRKNLLEPLSSIDDERNIRVDIRTGDVPPNEKQKQLVRPPHILITTPESLAIILNSPKFSQKLVGLRWLIIDEIHELADNKRGVHLSMSVERLEHLTPGFTRIGLGATLHPLESAAGFLVGYEGNSLRDCKIVDVSWSKQYDLLVLSPSSDMVYTSSEEQNSSMYEMLEELIDEHKTTLVFTNTRSGTERVVFRLKKKYGERVEAHHGSLSKEIRWGVEDRLKKGELKAVVCSTSLELGIDIGYVDLVVQIGSPKSVTRAVQRIGRSGHNINDVARGRIIAMDRDDLLECSVMLRLAKERKLDRIHIPMNCLDVLAQHLVGMALNQSWEVDEALSIVRSSYCYHALTKGDFISLLNYLSGSYVELEDRRVYGKIWFDGGQFGRRGKYTRVIYYLNLGTIPDEVAVKVYTMNPARYVGSIEEDFLERLKKGDIFVLGGKTYEFRYARGLRAVVKDAEGASPTIPAWFSELLPLSYDLATEIGKYRKRISGTKGLKALEELPLGEDGRRAVKEYIDLQRRYAKVPNDREVLIERTKDMAGRNFLIFHFLYGRRINDALSRIFAITLAKKRRKDVKVVVNDNGFGLIIPSSLKIDVEELLDWVFEEDLDDLLKDNLKKTELMRRRFRHVAARSFLILKNYKGHDISVFRQQMNSETLLKVISSIDESGDFPVVKETYREIMEDVMDLPRAKEIIERLKKKEIRWRYLETLVPSPFAHNLIVLGEADVILMKDRKERIKELHTALLERLER